MHLTPFIYRSLTLCGALARHDGDAIAQLAGRQYTLIFAVTWCGRYCAGMISCYWASHSRVPGDADAIIGAHRATAGAVDFAGADTARQKRFSPSLLDAMPAIMMVRVLSMRRAGNITFRQR